MRLLQAAPDGSLTLTKDLSTPPASYAILSHTWGTDDDEVVFDDLEKKINTNKAGYAKLWFCVNQAQANGIDYSWVDTCCINKANHVELSKAITSMFRWYQEAAQCYVYLSDVSAGSDGPHVTRQIWEAAFRTSRWFTRGWTLQELLAPTSVEFFSVEGWLLGNKYTLEALIHDITTIPITALRGLSLSTFTVDERFCWTIGRNTKEVEDQAYCLLGIFGVYMPLIYGEGKNASTRLREEIRKGTGNTQSLSHTHWTVTRAPNPLFTGREDVLHELGAIIGDAVTNPPHQDQCRIVISGIGGQGKSEICLQLTHRFRQNFWGVFWIDISSPSQAERSFQHLAQTLSLPAKTWEEVCLGIANLKHPWLLVLDNADNPNLDYQLYIPTSPLGVVVITSRNEECQQYATSKAVVLEGLSTNAAQELLLKAARIPASQHTLLAADALKVADLLQLHPLALIQAGTYVSRGHCQLGEYPAIYEQQRQRLLRFHPAQVQSRSRDVYATFEASVDAIKQLSTTTSSNALELLPLLAVCSVSQVPLMLFKAGWEGAQKVSPNLTDNDEDYEVELLTPWHVSQLPSLLGVNKVLWDSFQLMEALQLLKAFALVSIEAFNESTSVSMHPLVHAWARDRQSDDEQHKSWLSMGCIVASARHGGSVNQIHDWQLQPHVESITGWGGSTMFTGAPPTLVCRVLVNCGWLLLRSRSDGKLLLLIQLLTTWLGLDEASVSQPWLGLYDLAARAFHNVGQPKKAIHLLKQVVAIRTGLEAMDHPLRLASLHAQAGAYRADGQAMEAIALLEEVVQIRAQSMALDHPDLLTSQHDLAGAYRANGQVERAVTLLTEVVKIRQQSLTVDHPDLLASQHELARTYEVNGQAKDAVALLMEVVKIREQSLATDHPDRLASQHALAGAYHANGEVEEAVALLTKVVQIREESLAAEHPSRLASQHTLAICLWDLGEHQNAWAIMDHVVTIRQQVLDEYHPDRRSSEQWLHDFHERWNFWSSETK